MENLYRWSNPRPREYRKTWVLSDFLTKNVVCDKTVSTRARNNSIGGIDAEGFTLLGKVTVDGSMQVMVGHRSNLDGSMRGRFYVKLHQADDTHLHGQMKIAIASASKLKYIPLIARHTKTWDDTDPTNIKKNPSLTAGIDIPAIWVTEDGFIQLLFKPETDGVTVDYDNANNKGWIDYTETFVEKRG